MSYSAVVLIGSRQRLCHEGRFIGRLTPDDFLGQSEAYRQASASVARRGVVVLTHERFWSGAGGNEGCAPLL